MNESTASLILAQLAMGRISLCDAKTMYEATDSAAEVWQHRRDIRMIVPEATERLADIMREDLSMLERRAEEELSWCEKNKVRVIGIDDEAYPQRLRDCPDAPMALFVRGNANLNDLHIINIVGTRKCTPYGQDVTESIVKDLAELCPDVIVVSGLAYGIDINAHRAALKNSLRTVGVVAHGQDMMYPALHRNEANSMVLGTGAVVTEYMRGIRPEARNFLQRNRIIAGMADATIVVESAAHGGGLVTARIAQDYGREVFAVPGPVNASASMGCNNLIRDNKASLITSAQDIVLAMGWQEERKMAKARRSGIERSLFVEIMPDEQCVVEVMKAHGDCQVSVIAQNCSLSFATVSSLLFSLEMKGMVKALPGNVYHLVSK